MAETKKNKEVNYEFIKIGSSRDITVNSGIKGIDMTDPNMAGVENSFKVNEFWSKSEISIKQGNGFYPKFVAEWNSVKILSDELNILSINSKVYKLEDLPEESREECKKMYDDLIKYMDDYQAQKDKVAKVNALKKKQVEDKAATLLAKAYSNPNLDNL